MNSDHKIRDLQGSSRTFLFRLKRGVVNFRIKDLKARTLFITLGILVAVILIPTGMSYLPQGQQNSTAPGQNNQGDFINTVPAADPVDCSTLNSSIKCNGFGAQCQWNGSVCQTKTSTGNGSGSNPNPAQPDPFLECPARKTAIECNAFLSCQWDGASCKTKPSLIKLTGCETTNNRKDCNAIRGTDYCSDAERTWFLDPINKCISTGSGSGTVPAPVPINNPPAQPQGPTCNSSFCENINLYGNDVGHYNNAADNNGYPATAQDCQIGCQADSRCVAWTFQKDTKDCWLKNPIPSTVYDDTNTTSGIKSGNSAPPPPASTNTCTGDSKVLCGNQCYGVVAGACKNWQCVNGAPKCADTASNGGTTGGGSNTTAPGTASGNQCASFGGLAGCNAYAKQTYGDSYTCNSTCIQFGNQANGGAPGGNTNGGSGNTGNTGTISCNTVCKQQATPVGTYCGTGSPTNGTCACTLCTVLSGGEDTSGNPTNKNVAVSNNSTNQPGSTATNTPTATLPANSASIAFNLTIPGVGNGGNGINNGPTPASRTLEITATSNSQDKSASGQLTYDPTSGSFKGTISIPNATGLNTIKARFNNSLWKSLGNLTLTANQSVSAQSAELTTGDINQDNELNLLDYNLLISCFGDKSCNNKQQSDLNMDGKVDEADLNILYSVFSERHGQ